MKAALGAKHVIRVCSSEDKGAALAAARRLVREAPAIRALVDLTNASIAIDDCYQVRTVLCVTRVVATCVPTVVCKLAGPALLVDLANTPTIRLTANACVCYSGWPLLPPFSPCHCNLSLSESMLSVIWTTPLQPGGHEA